MMKVGPSDRSASKSRFQTTPKISIRGIVDAQNERFVAKAGQAMQCFIICGESIKDLPVKDRESFKTLRTVFNQNFVSEGGEPLEPTKPIKLKKVSTGKDHVSSPHEADARYANKGKTEWLGYKAQVAETTSDHHEDINFITYINSKYIEEKGIEGTLSGLVRGLGVRRSRHRGKNKLQLTFTGAAANILRLHRQRQT